MKSRKPVLAMTGTTLLLLLVVGLHASGQLGGPHSIDVSFFQNAGGIQSGAVALDPTNVSAFATAGKEADAICGDVYLENGYLTAVIAQPLATRHANMTVKDVAGALIDFSSNRQMAGGTAGMGGDQLAAFYPGRKAFPYRSISLLGPDGTALPTAAPPVRGATSAVVIKAEGADDRPEVTVTYELAQNRPYLVVTSTFTNRTEQPLKVALEDDFRVDGQKEEITRSPNGTVDRFWIYDRYWGQAYGLDAEGYKLQLTSDARVSTIKYENAAGETSVALPPGDSFQLKRRVYPGATIFDVHAVAARTPELAYAMFSVPAGDQEIGNLSLELSQGDAVIGKARLLKANSLFTSIPTGDYSARLQFCGSPVGAVLPVHIEAGNNKVSLPLGAAWGKIAGTITDASGGPIPCKIALSPVDEDARLDFGPETGEFAVRNLIYTPNGQFLQTVPTGVYNVTISHGPEFDRVQIQVQINPKATVSIAEKLVQSVDTSGWVSSDFHSHSTPSGDNTSSQLGRVLNLVCEHIEFAPCTEHNRVSTYEPHLKALKIEKFLSSVSGIELTGTPLPLNHQNAFPMKYTPGVQDGGGPTSGPDLETQIERLALWDQRSEKLVQVNHPDIGWMFYDKDGDGKPDAGFERAFPFMDVVEIHPIDDALKLEPNALRGTTNYHNTVFNWLQLLNQGFRIYGVVNTDAHYNFHGSGFLRNWIQSTTDDPMKIDPMEMAHAAEQGRLLMSNGPFLEVTASETGKSEKFVAGQDLRAASGKVTLKVRVQCSNWLDVNRLFVLVNGRCHPLHDYSRERHPDAFRSGVVKFDRALELQLKDDAHLVVVTGQVGGTLGEVFGPTYGKAEPTALSNPIFVDVDGKGFQPNKDTLDAPLPVKHPNSK